MIKFKPRHLRKTHRWLGVLIGIQFLFWTIGGLYFSWTDLDEIHGDHFLKPEVVPTMASQVISHLDLSFPVHHIEIRLIENKNWLWAQRGAGYCC